MSEPLDPPPRSILDLVGIGLNTSGVEDWDSLEPEVAAAVKLMDTGEYSYMLRGSLSVQDIRDIIAAAAPHIRRAEREQIAQQIEAYKPVAHPVVCPPEIAYQAAQERAAAIARGGSGRG